MSVRPEELEKGVSQTLANHSTPLGSPPGTVISFFYVLRALLYRPSYYLDTSKRYNNNFTRHFSVKIIKPKQLYAIRVTSRVICWMKYLTARNALGRKLGYHITNKKQ